MDNIMLVSDIREILRGKGRVYVGVDLTGKGNKSYILANKQALIGILREFDPDDLIVVNVNKNGKYLIGWAISNINILKSVICVRKR